MNTKILTALFLLIALTSCSKHLPLTTVSSVDFNRYSGLWYEIASLPNSFQEGCVATTARYRIVSEEDIEVINSCRDQTLDGKERTAKGRAWVVGEGKLKVQFFWPFSGDYWILDLGPNYEYALIGVPSRKYLWVLSRSPQLAPAVLNQLLEKAKSEGFDTSWVRMTLVAPYIDRH